MTTLTVEQTILNDYFASSLGEKGLNLSYFFSTKPKRNNKQTACYNREILTSDQGLFFKGVNLIQHYCRRYRLVEYIDKQKEGEIYTFQRSLGNGCVKGVQASRLFVDNPRGFSGYLVRFTFYVKEV